jgi:hypothetical protein
MSNGDILSALRMERDTTFSVVRSGQRHLKKIDEAIEALTGSRCEFQKAMVKAGSQIVTSAETASKENNQLPKSLFEKLMKLLNSETPVSEYGDTELRNIMKVPYLTSRLRSKIKDTELEAVNPMAEEPKTEQPEEPESEQSEEPETEQPEEPEAEEPEVEQPEEPEVEQPEEPEVDQPEEPEAEQSEEPEAEQLEKPNPVRMPRRSTELEVVHTPENSVSNVVFRSDDRGPLPRDRMSELWKTLESMILAGEISDLSEKDDRDVMKVHTLSVMKKLMQWRDQELTDRDWEVINNNSSLQELMKKRPERKAKSSEPKRSDSLKHMKLQARFRRGMTSYKEAKENGKLKKLNIRTRELETLNENGLITAEEYSEAKEILEEQNALV